MHDAVLLLQPVHEVYWQVVPLPTVQLLVLVVELTLPEHTVRLLPELTAVHELTVVQGV